MAQGHAASRSSRRKFERHQAGDRRKALIEAALRSLAREGQEGLSVRRIAAEAGVSVGLINHHFPSRVALIAAAYRHLHGRLAASLEEAVRAAPEGPRARLSAYLRASFAGPSLDPDVLHIWIVFWGLSRSMPEIRAVREETYAETLGVLERLIGEVIASPSARAGQGGRRVSARLLAIGLTALLDGLWLESCLNPATFRPEEGIALAEAWVAGLL